jgi:hypothetical protein
MQVNTPNTARYMPSPETVEHAWQMLMHERNRLIALSIALTTRMEDKERLQEDSTELILMQLLDEHICSMETMNVVSGMLTGEPT